MSGKQKEESDVLPGGHDVTIAAGPHILRREYLQKMRLVFSISAVLPYFDELLPIFCKLFAIIFCRFT